MNLEHPSWYINEMNVYGGSTEANRKTLHLFTLKKLTTRIGRRHVRVYVNDYNAGRRSGYNK
jgi:hypothetical protein